MEGKVDPIFQATTPLDSAVASGALKGWISKGFLEYIFVQKSDIESSGEVLLGHAVDCLGSNKTQNCSPGGDWIPDRNPARKTTMSYFLFDVLTLRGPT